jgi:hypothetical protein
MEKVDSGLAVALKRLHGADRAKRYYYTTLFAKLNRG